MKNQLLIIYLIISSSFAFAQDKPRKLSSESFIAAKVAVLDVIINDARFDSINKLCNKDSCLFWTDEEFYEEIIIKIKEQNPKFAVIKESQQSDFCYWSFDFYINPYLEDPKEAIVQMECVLKRENISLIGVGMEKEGKTWRIKDFTIIE